MKKRSASAVIWLVVFTFFCMSTPGSSRAATAWTKTETKNFVLIGDAAEADIRTAAVRLERFRSTLLLLFPQMREAKTSRTNVFVFKDAASFRPFKPKRADGTPDDQILGYFQASDGTNHIAVSADSEGTRNYGTIFHEYTHFLVNANFGKTVIPPWLNEGLAEYFQTFQLNEASVAVGIPHADHLRFLNQNQLIPWDEFFKIDNFTLHQRGGHSRTVFYSQAWALMHFLFQGEKGLNAQSVTKLIGELRRSNTPQKAIQTAFALDQASIEKGVKLLMAKRPDQFQPVSVPDDSARIVEQSAPMTEAMSSAYLGDLLYRLQDDASAEAFLLKSMKLEPNRSQAHATMGMLRLRQRKFDNAKQHLARAMAADQKNHLVHFYHAFLLLREQMDEFGSISRLSSDTAAKVRDSLRRSIALDPDFPESYKLLAFVAMVTNSDLNEALSSLKRALILEPGNQEYALMTAQIYLWQEKVEEARSIAERLLQTADDDRIRNEARDTIRSAEAYVKAKDESNVLSLGISSNNSEPLILRRQDLSEADVLRIEEEREVNNLNLLIERPNGGEAHAVGVIEQIACRNDNIYYRFTTASGVLNLTSRGFDGVHMKILHKGTRTLIFQCDSSFASELTSITYRPDHRRSSGTDGVLRSISFVPKIFKFKSDEEMSRIRRVIIEGLPPTDVAANLRTAAADQAELDRQTRESQLKNLEERLRRPEKGEKRIIGIPEKLLCDYGKITLAARIGPEMKYFETSEASIVVLRSFTPNAGILSFGCRSTLPSIPAVITFRHQSPTGGSELVAIEFVPSSYQLPLLP